MSTIEQPTTLSGVGLHTGANVTVGLLPAKPGEGRYFVRTDLGDRPLIPACLEMVHSTNLCTELGNQQATVKTVEHLLAALGACGVDNIRIELNGEEVPLLDGSAQPWVEAINQAGITKSQKKPKRTLSQPVLLQEKDAYVAALPASVTRFTYEIDFDYKAIGQQWYSWSPTETDFATVIAPARTFGFAEQIDQLREAGLIQGGSLDNALVCSREGWLNPPLRFADEPVRHKLLDLIGDISLLGAWPQAHFLAYKASHKLHTRLARAISLKLNFDL